MAGLLGKKFPTPVGMQDSCLDCGEMRSSDLLALRRFTDIRCIARPLAPFFVAGMCRLSSSDMSAVTVVRALLSRSWTQCSEGTRIVSVGSAPF